VRLSTFLRKDGPDLFARFADQISFKLPNRSIYYMVELPNKLAILLAQQEEIAKQVLAVRTEAVKEIGDIAVKAGLHSIDISTKDLQAAFAEIAARFSKETNQS